MAIVDQINDEIKECMKSKDKVRLSVLRMIKSKIMTVDTKGEMDDEGVLKLINSYAKNIKDTVTQYKELGKTEQLQDLEVELKVVEEFLPKPLSEEETKSMVEKIIKENSLTKKKEMGQVMRAVFASGKTVDGALVKKIAESLLTE